MEELLTLHLECADCRLALRPMPAIPQNAWLMLASAQGALQG